MAKAHIEQEASAGAAAPGSKPLAALRQDIELHPGPRDARGAPSHVLRDPACESYLHIGAREFEILARWGLGAAPAVAAAVSDETSYRVTTTDVLDLEAFLAQNGLLRGGGAGLYRRARATTERSRTLTSRLGAILFQRIAFGSPQRFLDRTAWLAAPFFLRRTWLALVLALIVAALMIAREWSQFLDCIMAGVSLEGAVLVMLAVVMAKILHELAHGYASRRYGADVPVAGLSLVLLVPFLYVETSAAWTVPERARRIVIAAAGVAAEFVVGIVALAAWPFIEPGAMRNAAAFCGTTLVVLSLSINVNPLMRFDGYYILSEALAIENLAQRGQEVLGATLRRWLAADRGTHGEAADAAQERVLLIYGAAAAVWRILVQIGIALAAVAWLPATVGLPLAAAILIIMVGGPVLQGAAGLIRSVLSRRSLGGGLRLGLLAGGLAAALLVPWRSSLLLPVLIEGGIAHDVFAPEPAQLCALHVSPGMQVARGNPIGTLCAPELASDLARARVRRHGLETLMARQLTSSPLLADVAVRREEHVRTLAEIDGLQLRQERLALTAPSDGEIVIPTRGLAPGVWVRTDQPILRVIDRSVMRATAYAEERDLQHLESGARARLWPDGQPLATIEGGIESVHEIALPALDDVTLAATAGGAIPTRAGPSGAQVPEQGIYKVVLRLTPGQHLPAARIRGFVLVETRPRNLMTRLVQRAIGLWKRELG